MSFKKLITFLLMFSVMSGCKKEILPQELNNPQISLGRIENHEVSLEQAKKIAILQSIYPNQLRTKQGKNRSFGKIYLGYEVQKQNPAKSVKNTVSFKGEGNDVSCYVINYNEGGFVIIAGDDRMVPILAFSDTGTSSDPSKYNPGLKMWMDDNIKFINAIRNGKIQENKMISFSWRELEHKSQLTLGNAPAVATIPPCDPEHEDETYATEWSYRMQTVPWGQGAPYNGGIPLESCGRPLIGCVPLAAAIVMKFHEYPTYIWNWSLVPDTGATSTTQTLLANMHDWTNSSNSCTNSLAVWHKGGSTLFQLGYSTDGYDDFYYPTVKSDILNGLPVILRAESGGAGHQWVADGFKEWAVYTCLEDEVGEPPIQWRNPPVPTHGWVNTNTWDYLYMNWGWYGLDNAYYSAYAWNAPTYGYNFNSSLKMLTGIHP